MGYLIVLAAVAFGYISVSMFIAGFKEKEGPERDKLMRSGFGTLVLTLMGISLAWNSFFPAAPPPGQ